MVYWLFQAWPTTPADIGPWDFGWASIAALATLLLAGVTAWLAWTTRRLARATAEEVQGQTRPVVVPTGDPIHVGAEQPSPDQEGKPRYPEPGAVYGERRGWFRLTVRMRNIGVGPALNLEGAAARDRYPTNRITALPPGEDREIGVSITLYNEGAHPFTGRISPLTVQYEDLAGREFTTSFSWSFRGFDQDSDLTAYLGLSSGKTPNAREGIQLLPEDYANPLGAVRTRFWPVRFAIGKAWAIVMQVPEYGQRLPLPAPLPFHTRVHAAWRELFPRRRVQRFQASGMERPCISSHSRQADSVSTAALVD